MTQTEKGMEKIMERLQLEQYLSRGVENIIKGMKKASTFLKKLNIFLQSQFMSIF